MAMMKSGENLIRREQAKAYLEGQEDSIERDGWEQLLLKDEDTFVSYMEMLDELKEDLPSLENSSAFTERVMGDWMATVRSSVVIEEVAGQEEGSRRYRWYDKTIFHYAVAASLTLLIMSSGMFDKLLTGEMELIVPKKDNSPSYSEQFMQATSGWLSRIMDGRQK
ncbi:hypothetical protein [Paenibacillus sp. FSL H3-0310]|uniref:hypothetical protein n=1 Tax=Paenibacillus sp. FSL H3-0310 TaxID=2921429 RepID=UPI0030FB581D